MSDTCKVNNCTNQVRAMGYCSAHYQKWRKYGDAEVSRKVGTVNKAGYKVTSGKLSHISIAEKALGRKLPKGAEVHHWDENKKNNDPENLVICPDHSYHMLLHARAKALEACGNPNYRKCTHCQQYDDIGNLRMYNRTYRHKACASEYNRQLFHRKSPTKQSKEQSNGDT